MTRLLYHRLLVILLAAIVVFGGWFAADWQLRQAEAAANWHEQTQVLILDAGHGGEDGGAVAPDGTVEADINLEIALRARAIAELTGVRVVMTRESAQIAYPDDAATVAQRKKADQHRRAELVREMDNAVLISIHPWSSAAFCPTLRNVQSSRTLIIRRSLRPLSSRLTYNTGSLCRKQE